MKAPIRELTALRSLLDEAGAEIDRGAYEVAESLIRKALSLDMYYAPACDLMMTLCEARGDAVEAAAWRERARELRKEVWQRQVEAEARGHHEMLGVPIRHEIP